MSYEAIITKLERVRDHSNADRLKLATVAGMQVIVGLDNVDGDVGVFFRGGDGKLSDEFCKANDMYPRFDDNGKRAGGGFIDPKHRRVMVQRFRGERSYGLWMPLSSLSFTNYTGKLSVGDTFTTLNGIPICEKYFTKATFARNSQKTSQNIRELKMLPMHVDTAQFAYKADQMLHKGDLVTLTWKLHGTSQRSANTVIEPTKFWDKVKAYFGAEIWQTVHGTRKVILKSFDGGFYGNDEFRKTAIGDISLRKGEAIFYEVVGWVNEQTPIMNKVDCKLTNDKAFVKQYGESMIFKYGCVPGTQDVYVYRIVQHSADGFPVELSWNQLKQRCEELGLKHVPEAKSSFIFDGDHGSLGNEIESLIDGPDVLDPSHIKEGLVVRVDKVNGETHFLKAKSFMFYVLEQVVKADERNTDLEEIS